MFTIPHRTTLALARSRPQLSRSIFRIAASSTLHPPLVCSSLPGIHRVQRNFSVSPHPRVQYTRFSNEDTRHRRRWEWSGERKIITFIAVTGAVYIVAHLEQVPETGRWRFMNTSPRMEARLDKAFYQALISQFEGKVLPPNHHITRQVHRVVSDLLEASDLGTIRSSSPRTPAAARDTFWEEDPFTATASSHEHHDHSNKKEWNLLVVDDPEVVNAAAGFSNIVVFTGILPVCGDDAGLAAVVAHEVGHIVARHASERMSSVQLLAVVSFLISGFGLDLGLTQLLNYLVFELPNSRTQELEADTLGIRIAAKACYDPQAAVEMHKRLARASETGGLGSKFEFLRTHPLPGRRIKHLEELVPEAYEIRAASPWCSGVRDSIQQFLGGVSRWG